jgi:hypothetical protein
VVKQRKAPAERNESLSIETQVRIRDELHSLQVGLNLLRDELLSGDLHGADLTYATIQHCLYRLSNDQVLAATRMTGTCHTRIVPSQKPSAEQVS